jgi:hypothetical protein
VSHNLTSLSGIEDFSHGAKPTVLYACNSTDTSPVSSMALSEAEKSESLLMQIGLLLRATSFRSFSIVA